VHLVPHVPTSGPVATLCGQTLAEGTFQGWEGEADCRACVRRRDDPARVSSAFFQSDVGAELLQRSLEQAKERRREGTPAPERPQVRRPPARERPAAKGTEPAEPEPPAAPVARELRSPARLRATFPDVYLSPEGVIVRVSDGSIGHVTFNGPVDVRRRDDTVTIRIGDVVLELTVRT
jgi:hypothetical protein